MDRRYGVEPIQATRFDVKYYYLLPYTLSKKKKINKKLLHQLSVYKLKNRHHIISVLCRESGKPRDLHRSRIIQLPYNNTSIILLCYLIWAIRRIPWYYNVMCCGSYKSLGQVKNILLHRWVNYTKFILVLNAQGVQLLSINIIPCEGKCEIFMHE